MSKPFTYECHVTLRPIDVAQAITVAEEHKFKTSCLVGDELDAKVKYIYCTTHSATYSEIFDRMNKMIGSLSCPIIRKKIELILLDDDYRKVPRYDAGELIEIEVDSGVWIDATVDRLNNGSITEPESLMVRPLPKQGFQTVCHKIELGNYRKKANAPKSG